MHVASHDLYNMKLRTCLDTGFYRISALIFYLVISNVINKLAEGNIFEK
jgi:hypothetical protein